MMTQSNLLFPISSDAGHSESCFYSGYVLDVDDKLKHEISRAWDVLLQNPTFSSISIRASGAPLPGSDFYGEGPSEKDEDRLSRTLDEIGTNQARPMRKRESALIGRCMVGGARGETLVVYRHSSPVLRLYQKGDGEPFSSSGLDVLAPEGLKREAAATKRRNRRIDTQQRRDAAESRAS